MLHSRDWSLNKQPPALAAEHAAATQDDNSGGGEEGGLQEDEEVEERGLQATEASAELEWMAKHLKWQSDSFAAGEGPMQVLEEYEQILDRLRAVGLGTAQGSRLMGTVKSFPRLFAVCAPVRGGSTKDGADRVHQGIFVADKPQNKASWVESLVAQIRSIDSAVASNRRPDELASQDST